MPKLRVFSGKEIIALFERLGFVVLSRKGSHVKLRRVTNGVRQTLTIPAHAEIDRGTVQGIYRQACRYVSETELRKLFYTE